MNQNKDERRGFLKKGVLLAGGVLSSKMLLGASTKEIKETIVKPPCLKDGDTIAVSAPAGVVTNKKNIQSFKKTLESLGFKVVLGSSLYRMHGYFAGTDQQRADEFNRFIRDDEVKAIIGMRGGWGCARILPLIDYEQVKKTPKIVMGMSDITSLLVSLYVKAGLVSFHGAVGNSSWNAFSVGHFRKVTMSNEQYTMINHSETEEGAFTLNKGIAEGVLIGGNLSVISGIIGSDYEPDWNGKILFLEDLNEEPYKVDRMLTHLKLAGVMDKVSGLVFGDCRKCGVSVVPSSSFTFREVLNQHAKEMKVPIYYGANIGHITNKFTLPIGVRVRIDAFKHQITLLESPMYSA